MRRIAITSLAVVSIYTHHAAAEPAFKLVEDAALGAQLSIDKRLLGDTEAAPALEACLKASAHTSSAVFWVELDRRGKAIAAAVHGSGKPALDTCLATALRKLTAADKLGGPVALAGRIDLVEPGKTTFLPSARISTAAVMLNAHDARWQLTVNRVGYTANRAMDISQALDGKSAEVAACASKRAASKDGAEAIAWFDGKKAIVRSGVPSYDACIAKVIETIALPAAESALWLQIALLPPAEPLAPRTLKAGLSREDALRDALTTAVRSRKAVLLTCLDKFPKATLTKVGIKLAGGKASISKVATGDAEADTCVRGKLDGVTIPNAAANDKLELDVTLERE